MAIPLNTLSILLIILTLISYLPQYRKLVVLRSTSAISVAATLLLALSAQAQIATMYYLFMCPPFKRYGLVIPKPPATSDYLNLAQLLTQWICSVILLALVLVVRSAPRDSSSSNESVPSNRDVGAFPSTKLAVTLIMLHAGLCVFGALLAGQPRDDWLDLPFVTIMSVNEIIINPLITVTTAIAFALQVATTRAAQGPSALSRMALLLQAATFLVLAVLWPFRFKMPRNLSHSRGVWVLDEWYPHVGWSCINNAIVAVGECIVLYTAAKDNSGMQSVGEEQSLLGT